MINVAIIGGAGLSGLELIRIFSRHSNVTLKAITSGRYAGVPLGEAFPEFARLDLVFQKHDAPLEGVDVVFLAVPNQASLDLAPKLLEQGLRVIDLSGVFRLHDVPTFEQAYNLKHTALKALDEAVFGLPEAFRKELPNARLVANPGCYPTGALLGMLPMQNRLGKLATAPIVDAKSGVSGAGGRVEDDSTNFMEVNENFKAYKVFGHQHMPEIEEYLTKLTPFEPDTHGAVMFTPHLLPISRGILCTIYLRFSEAQDPADVRRAYAAYAEAEPFVTLLEDGKNAELKMVQHTNNCVVSLHHDESGKNWVVLTAIDNLVKGAAGQAVQNMNLMFGEVETAGLI